MKTFLTLILGLVVSGSTMAQTSCPNGQCPLRRPTINPEPLPAVTSPVLSAPFLSATVPSTAASSVPKTECFKLDSEPGQWHLRVGGIELGTLDEATGDIKTVDGNTWRFNVTAGAKPPPCSFGQTGAVPPGGIEPGHLDPAHGEVFTIRGKRVDRQAAFQSLLLKAGSGDLLDDSQYPRLTVIGSDADRKKVVDDLKAPPLSELVKNLLVHEYAPSNWAVQEAGFKTDGAPTIYIQAPSGQVLHRQDDYAGGAERLAGAIRKSRPDYDPKKDPDVTKPKSDPVPATPAAPAGINSTWIILGGLVAAYFLIGRSRS